MNQIAPARLPMVQFCLDVELEVAHYNETDTYKGLYLTMQPVFGWPVIRDWKHPGNAWVHRLPLAELGTLCGQLGYPCLACLVRHQDGSIGDGYVTGHYNTHGVNILRPGHPYRCPCCRFYINRTARAETQIAWARF